MQVYIRSFEVGKNSAFMPGAVVYREEVFEVSPSAPATSEVLERPYQGRGGPGSWWPNRRTWIGGRSKNETNPGLRLKLKEGVT